MRDVALFLATDLLPAAADPEAALCRDQRPGTVVVVLERGEAWQPLASGGAVGDRVWRFAVTGNVQAVELSGDGSRLYLGGHFGLNGRRQRLCGTEIRGLLAVDPVTGAPRCQWLPRLAPFENNYHGPWALIATQGGLWVGGGWQKIGGEEQRNIAHFSS